MEVCRETMPPFFYSVKRYISTQTHDKTLSFLLLLFDSFRSIKKEDKKDNKDNFLYLFDNH